MARSAASTPGTMNTIGILGGAFDPIHFGHLRMAQELAEICRLDQVRFIPTANPPHRSQPRATPDQRLAMVKLAIADNPVFCCDEREISRHAEKSSPSYTIDTLQSLNIELGEEVAICLLLGSDAFLGLPTWHRWEELLDYCHIIVAHRPSAALQAQDLPLPLKQLWDKSGITDAVELAKNKAGRIMLLPITPLDISSTHIRENLKLGKSPRYLMPNAVIDYIEAQPLYF